MASFPQPSFDWNANRETEVDRFKRHVDLMMSFNRKEFSTESSKIKYIIITLGTRGVAFYYSTWDTKKYPTHLESFWSAFRNSMAHTTPVTPQPPPTTSVTPHPPPTTSVTPRSPPLPSFDWNSPKNEAKVDRFKRHVELSMSLDPQLNTDADRLNYVLLTLGSRGIELHHGLTQEDKADLPKFWVSFTAILVNPLIHRMNLTQYIQSHDETTSQFVCRIRLQVNKCKYASKDEMIRDQLVRGTKHTDAREHILDMEETTLCNAISICQKFENIAIARRLRPTNQIQEVKTTPTSHKKPPTCRSCGRVHDICPAIDTTCGRCGKRNHWASVCQQDRRTINKLTFEKVTDSRTEVYVNTSIDNVSIRIR